MRGGKNSDFFFAEKQTNEETGGNAGSVLQRKPAHGITM